MYEDVRKQEIKDEFMVESKLPNPLGDYIKSMTERVKLAEQFNDYCCGYFKFNNVIGSFFTKQRNALFYDIELIKTDIRSREEYELLVSFNNSYFSHKEFH